MKKALLWSLFFCNLGVILIFWWLGSGSYVIGSAGALGPATLATELIAFGRLAGLLAEFLILVQLVLIGRIQPVERLYGFDKLNALHRSVGFVILGLLLFHPVALSFGYAGLSSGTFTLAGAYSQFLTFIFTWQDVFKAFLALLLLITVVSVSIAIIRKKVQYESWYFIHLLVYVVIFLAFDHQINTADVSTGAALYYWLCLNFIVFGLVLVYRFIRPLWLFSRHRFYVDRIVQETPTVYSIYVRGRKLERFHFEAGQFANLFFLAKGMWYSHPFSFSTAHNGRFMRFSIKGVGDFSNDAPKLTPGTKVIIDGPLGAFTERFAASGVSKFLFIAGGIGITPIRAMIEEVADRAKHESDAILLYACRNVKEIVFKDELAKLRLPVVPFLSDEERPGYQSGMVTAEAITHFAPDVRERDVYICGPLPMMKAVIGHLQALGVPHRHIHYEIFAY